MDRLNDNKKIIGLYDTKKVLHLAFLFRLCFLFFCAMVRTSDLTYMFLFHGRVGKGQETEKKSCERK